jgi:mRNA interferase RelE/StbE
MPSYKVLLKPSVEKDLRVLPKALLARVLSQIESLKDDPYSRRSVQLEDGEGLRRIRVGDYRVIYGVDKGKKVILVHYVRHRREVYRNI